MTNGWEVAVHGSLKIADRSVHAWYDPVGRSLEYGEIFRHFRNLWSDLRCCCAVANQSNSLVLQIIGPIPSCRVHLLSGKGVEAFDVRVSGDVELALRFNDSVLSLTGVA